MAAVNRLPQHSPQPLQVEELLIHIVAAMDWDKTFSTEQVRPILNSGVIMVWGAQAGSCCRHRWPETRVLCWNPILLSGPAPPWSCPLTHLAGTLVGQRPLLPWIWEGVDSALLLGIFGGPEQVQYSNWARLELCTGGFVVKSPGSVKKKTRVIHEQTSDACTSALSVFCLPGLCWRACLPPVRFSFCWWAKLFP